MTIEGVMSDGTQADLSKAQTLSSDDERIASVDDNGVVHGVGEGTATILQHCNAERYYSPK